MSLPYGRLYLRMALHIGAALAAFVLIGVASFAFIAAWELSGYVEARNSPLGQQAAAVLEKRGPDGLRQWLQSEADIPQNASVYILDPTGNDILNRPLSRSYSNFVRKSLLGVRDLETASFRPVRLAPELIGPGGEIYTFLPVPRDITVWGSLSTALGLLLAAGLVIASVAWLIARAFGRPISELQQAVRHLANGEIATRVPATLAGRRDELGDLAADFNQMAAQLEQLIHGREELMRELSHELRSPLMRLQATLALSMAHQRLLPAEQQRIEQEIERMNGVIGAILRYSSLDTHVPMQIQLVRIDELLRQLLEVEEVEARNRGCRLQLAVAGDLTVAGDPGLLRSALENILRNAIRFAPSGSSIDVTASRERREERDWIVVQISDRGPGIPTNQLERVFEPYARVAGTRADGGTGLGLAIVKRVMQRHEGEVSARQREGGGLTVIARLPAAELY